MLSTKMETIQSAYSELSLKEYEKKIKTTFLIKHILNQKTLVRAAEYYFKTQRIDIEDFLVSKMRGFPGEDNFLQRFRIRPNAALLRNIAYRTTGYTEAEHQEKIKNFMHINVHLTSNGHFVPGCAVGVNRSAWLLPMIVANKSQFREYANQNGLFVFRGATQIKLVSSPLKRTSQVKPEYLGAPMAQWICNHVVYLPINSSIGDKDLKELTRRSITVATQYNMYLN